jgi:hypothetical protein
VDDRVGVHHGACFAGACTVSSNVPRPDQLRLNAPTTLVGRSNKGVIPRHKPGEKFLKGPIPLNWLGMAAAQPGKALHVGLAIWFWAGVRRSRQVPFRMLWLKTTLGVDRCSAYRGLDALERVGLVSVIRHRGRKSLVTLLDAPAGLQQRAAPVESSGSTQDRSTACVGCRHPKKSHCKPGTTHLHADARPYQCTSAHCLDLVERDGHSMSCPCMKYEPVTAG